MNESNQNQPLVVPASFAPSTTHKRYAHLSIWLALTLIIGYNLIALGYAVMAILGVFPISWTIFLGILATSNILNLLLLCLTLTPVKEWFLGKEHPASIDTIHQYKDLPSAFMYFAKQVEEKDKSLRTEQAQLEASINSLTVGFIMTDTTGKISVMNAAAKRILSVSALNPSPALFRGSSQLNLRIEDIQRELQGTLDLQSKVESCLHEKKTIELKCVVFKDLYLHISINPMVVLKDDLQLEFIGSVILIEDITQQQILERAKAEFFSIASHELRTPLTAIRGNTAMIKQYFGDQLKDPNLVEMVDDIHKSSIRLIDIVNDFLDLARLEQGRMTFKRSQFDLIPLVEQVVKEFDSLAKQKNISIIVDANNHNFPKVVADPDKVKQVFFNLIGNALKFTEHGSITLKFETQPKFLKVLVVDTGMGLSPQNQKLLFHKFQQASDNILVRDATRGTGVGLYICKLIVEGMGGEIKLERSEVGIGSTFGFTLPLFDYQTSAMNETITAPGTTERPVATTIEPQKETNTPIMPLDSSPHS